MIQLKVLLSLIHNQANGGELFSPELAGRLAVGFKFLMPLYDYFITLDSDPTPVKKEQQKAPREDPRL